MQFRKDLPENGGSKNFVKLKDKESIIGVFMGNLHEFFVVWEGNKTKIVPEGTPDSKFRFRVNFVAQDGAVYVPKIFEQGATVYRLLAELHDEYDLSKTFVKITRNGTGKDTTYSLLPSQKKVVSKELAEHLNEIELLPLETKSAISNGGDDEIPF